jgi:hypothetical protein
MVFSTSRLRLPPSRRLVCDLLHFARQVPLFPLERSCALGELEQLRQAAHPRFSWAVLFLKAYGLLAADYPTFRQAYMRWPWPHLYQHPHSVAMLAVNRADPDGERLYWGRFIRPEAQPLTELQTALDRYKNEPPPSVFARQVRFSRLPTPLRWLGLWLTLNVSGASRARRLGTFGLSTLAGNGAVNRYHPTCLTTSLTYGPIDRAGRALVTILYDHRVMDGSCVARALADLEAILQGAVSREVKEHYGGKRHSA